MLYLSDPDDVFLLAEAANLYVITPSFMPFMTIEVYSLPRKLHYLKLLFLKPLRMLEYDTCNKKKRWADSAVQRQKWLIIRVKKCFSSKDDQPKVKL